METISSMRRMAHIPWLWRSFAIVAAGSVTVVVAAGVGGAGDGQRDRRHRCRGDCAAGEPRTSGQLTAPFGVKNRVAVFYGRAGRRE